MLINTLVKKKTLPGSSAHASTSKTVWETSLAKRRQIVRRMSRQDMIQKSGHYLAALCQAEWELEETGLAHQAGCAGCIAIA
jgi:hypothetical protein